MNYDYVGITYYNCGFSHNPIRISHILQQTFNKSVYIFCSLGTLKQQQELQSSNVALHSSHLSRRDSSLPQKVSSCSNCSMDQCPSHSDLHHLTPQKVQRKLSFLQASQNNVFASNGERKGGMMEVIPSCVFVGNKRYRTEIYNQFFFC